MSRTKYEFIELIKERYVCIEEELQKLRSEYSIIGNKIDKLREEQITYFELEDYLNKKEIQNKHKKHIEEVEKEILDEYDEEDYEEEEEEVFKFKCIFPRYRLTKYNRVTFKLLRVIKHHTHEEDVISRKDSKGRLHKPPLIYIGIDLLGEFVFIKGREYTIECKLGKGIRKKGYVIKHIKSIGLLKQ